MTKPSSTASLRLPLRLRIRYQNWQHKQRLARLAARVSTISQSSAIKSSSASNLFKTPQDNLSRPKTVLFFNASARLGGLSQNAAFSLLTSWSLRLNGANVVHFVCQSGLSPCVLGTDREDHSQPPPCAACLNLSKLVFKDAEVWPFVYEPDPELKAALQELSLEALMDFCFYPADQSEVGIPLGKLVLPSARWALRRHHLPDTPQTRFLLQQYMLSAYSLIQQFNQALNEIQPDTAVIFNGIMYPEAAARWTAEARQVRVVTHEVGFQRFSSFFTEGDATAYPIQIPADFELSTEQNARLDAYLEKRFQGQFTMAGIQFWPEMRGLAPDFLNKAANFRQIVPIFTNVVYDTSQIHANVLFPHMFAWLDLLLENIRTHPDTLFVIRAHPDEMRPGTAKQSKESVHDWVLSNSADQIPNLVFIDSQEYISSYELIQRAKFVIVYNSSIGLESALMGIPVLCGGKARYTQYPIVFFPENQQGYQQQLEAFLESEKFDVPKEFQANARRFLYYQLYRTSLSFENFLENAPRAGFVYLHDFEIKQLIPDNSIILHTLVEGILNDKPFLLPENMDSSPSRHPEEEV